MQLADMVSAHAASEASRPALQAQAQAIDPTVPGYAAFSDKLDRDIATGGTEMIEKLRDRLAAALEAPLRDPVVAHWLALGGSLPLEDRRTS